uniref:Minor tail protein n=1 Tax=Micrococcus phage Olihed TaxID=3092209 RepID=A0AAU6R6Z4_9CAUD
MAVRRVIVQNPNSYKETLTVKVKVITEDPGVKVTDLIFQAGTTGTGWVPHVTEMPWTTGVVP